MAQYDMKLGDRDVVLVRHPEDVLDRVAELRQARDQTLPAMQRTAMMMDGGERAVAAMLGESSDKSLRDMPIANYMRDAMEAFATRLGAMPELRVDPPQTGTKGDISETKAKAGEKRAKIVSAYDSTDKIPLTVPMLARWVPGAAYAVYTIDPCKRVTGVNSAGEPIFKPYPKRTLHSPLDTMLAAWSPITDPEDVGFATRVPLRTLIHQYPEHEEALKKSPEAQPGTGGGVLLGGANRPGLGVEVVTYYDRNGTWTLIPDRRFLLDFVPNPLESGPAFKAFTKFNYSRLRGEYDDMIGPMIAMARLQILSELIVRKDVQQPTNLIGGEPISGPYKMGHNKVNVFDSNVQIDIPSGTSQFQAWQQLDRMERSLRIEGKSPVQDSGESPMSFVTGRGLNALSDRVERSVSEIQRIFEFGFQDLDSRTLEYDVMAWPEISKPMAGTFKGADFEDDYTPSKHIKRNFRTRRVYGAMASADQAARLNGIFLMHQAGWVSTPWVRSNIDGLGVPESLIEDQIRAERSEEALGQFMMAAASDPVHPEHIRALRMLINRLPAGHPDKKEYQEMLATQEQAMAEQQQAMQGMQGPPPSEQDILSALSGGGGSDPTTLARITASGRPEGGTQAVI